MSPTKGLVFLVVACALMAGGISVAARSGMAGPADVQEPKHVTMLVCSTGDEGPAVVTAATTQAALHLEKGKSCPEALKAILDAGQVIVDIEYISGRVVYTGAAIACAQDFNVSRSNKDRGLAAPGKNPTM